MTRRQRLIVPGSSYVIIIISMSSLALLQVVFITLFVGTEITKLIELSTTSELFDFSMLVKLISSDNESSSVSWTLSVDAVCWSLHKLKTLRKTLQ